MTAAPTILIMAGGTGGHVFPGLAVAEALSARGARVHWLGTLRGLEAELVPRAGIPLHTLSVVGLRGKSRRSQLQGGVHLLGALGQAVRLLWRLRPDCVLGMGGYAAGPGGVASWLLRRPLLIHEQNAVPGTTNRLLAHLAQRVLQGFPLSWAGPRGAMSAIRCVAKSVPCHHRQSGWPATRGRCACWCWVEALVRNRSIAWCHLRWSGARRSSDPRCITRLATAR